MTVLLFHPEGQDPRIALAVVWDVWTSCRGMTTKPLEGPSDMDSESQSLLGMIGNNLIDSNG